MSYFVGIDPGLEGIITVITSNLEVVAQHPFPLTPVVRKTLKSGPRKGQRIVVEKARYDVGAIFSLMRALKSEYKIKMVLSEKPQVRPTNGAKGNFTNGYGFGVLHMAIVAAGLKPQWIRPTEWQEILLKDVSGGDTKEQSVRKVASIWPNRPELLLRTPKCRTPDDNKTDSLLIAVYAVQMAEASG